MQEEIYQQEIDSENKRPYFKVVLIVGLIIGILLLALATIFFDDITNYFGRLNTERNVQQIDQQDVDDTELTAAEKDFPGVVCRNFSDIDEALKYYAIACGLDLSSQNLNSLPSSIARLANLNEINLSDNNFSEFPEVLSGLNNLVEINLSNNNISSLPSSISRLTNLQNLNLSNNNLNVQEQGRIIELLPSGEEFPERIIQF